MPHRIGSLSRKSIESLACDAAIRLCGLTQPLNYVVTLAPDWVLRLEPAASADEANIIGSYNPALHRVPRWVGLTRVILEDLRHEVLVLRASDMTPGVRRQSGQVAA